MIKKKKIEIVLLGHMRHSLDVKKIQRFKSRFFEVVEIERISDLPEPHKNYGSLDIVYSPKEISKILTKANESDIVLGIMNYRFEDRFYLHRVDRNKCCISIADVDILLLDKNISIENFILKNIFVIVVLYNVFGNISDDRVRDFVHQDTRGCLFDLNGDKYDVIYNTERPMICDSCKALINKKSIPPDFVKNIEGELRKIRKPWICYIEIFIKQYPFVSIFLTFFGSIVMNLLSSLIWDFLTHK